MNKSNHTKSIIFLTISALISVLSGYATNILLGRFLGPENYGIYGIIVSFITIINITQTAGVPQALSKFIAADQSKSEEIFKSAYLLQLVSNLAVALLIFILAVPISLLLHDSKLIPFYPSIFTHISFIWNIRSSYWLL